MANHAGLKLVKKSVRGKKGTVQRSYWVKSGAAVKKVARTAGGFLNRHKGKIAGAAALAGAAYLGMKHRGAIGGAFKGAHAGFQKGAGLANFSGRVDKMLGGKGESLRSHVKVRAAGALVGAAHGAITGRGQDVARRAASAATAGARRLSEGGMAARRAKAGTLMSRAERALHKTR